MGKIEESGMGEKIIELWYQGYSSIKISNMIGNVVTDRSIIRFLNKSGIATHDTRRIVNCEYCGKEFKKTRYLWRKSRHHFCSKECYWKHLKNPDYNRSVYHMRQAREIVRSTGFIIQPEECVHHKDNDNTNNDLGNLMVFANNSDHTRWHRMGKERSGVIPIWPPHEVDRIKNILSEKGAIPKEIHPISGDNDGVKPIWDGRKKVSKKEPEKIIGYSKEQQLGKHGKKK